MESSYSKHEENPEFWFNLKTLKVEVGRKSASPNRVGPFKTAEDAAQAIEVIRARNRAWLESESAED